MFRSRAIDCAISFTVSLAVGAWIAIAVAGAILAAIVLRGLEIAAEALDRKIAAAR